jgi:flagellar motor protein MotB
VTRLGQRRREPASHIDDWLMTYADTITLLLCFFVVFVIVSSARKDLPQKLPTPQILAVTAQIRPAAPPPRPQPVVPRPLPILHAAPAARPSDPVKAPVKAVAVEPAARTNEPPPPAKSLGMDGFSPLEADAAANRTLTVVPPPELVGSLKPQAAPAKVPVEVASASAPKPLAAASEPKGDRITTLEMRSTAFFASGSATLSDAGKAILQGLLPRLTAALAEGYRIKVEGHTDDTPIDTPQFPSNWELSTARASAVVHFFLEQGIPAERLRAVGYADTEPKLPDRDAAGNPIPANQAENRRVVIKLEKIEPVGR